MLCLAGNMETADSSSPAQEKNSDVKPSTPAPAPAPGASGQGNSADLSSSVAASASGMNPDAKNLKTPQASESGESHTGSGARSTFARFTSGLGLRLSASTPVADRDSATDTSAGRTGVFDSLTKGLVDSSRSAVKAVQVKARHMVSQNKRRYQVAFHLICDAKGLLWWCFL